MKIIFLDFDGVLNSSPWIEANEHRIAADELWLNKNLDHTAVARVQKIVQATGAKVVISSTWRLFHPADKLKNLLKDHGLSAEVVGHTPDLGGPRGAEISKWLNENGPVEAYAILDDDTNMQHVRHRLVCTTFQTGIQDEHVTDAIRLLES